MPQHFLWFYNEHCAYRWVNSSLPGQHGRHFTEDVFRCTLMNEKFCILIKISLKGVPKGPIGDKPALVEIMAWCQVGDKPFSEQSGTEPNLVAKTLVTVWHRLTKLVANISSEFHHRAHCWFSCQMATNKSSHACKLDTISVVYCSPIGNGSIRL